MLQVEAAMKQATSASATASKLMDDQSSSKKSGSGDKSGKVESLETEINTLKEGQCVLPYVGFGCILVCLDTQFCVYFFQDLMKTKKDRDAIKSQADSVSKEYDRLMKEHEKLQKKLSISSGDKKDD